MAGEQVVSGDCGAWACRRAVIKAMRGVIKSERELESLQWNTPGAGNDRPVEPENEAHVEDLVIGAQLSRAHQTVSNVPGKAFERPQTFVVKRSRVRVIHAGRR